MHKNLNHARKKRKLIQAKIKVDLTASMKMREIEKDKPVAPSIITVERDLSHGLSTQEMI